MKVNSIILVILLLVFSACNDEFGNNNAGGNPANPNNPNNPSFPIDPNNPDEGWDIPQNEVFDGGPGIDGIPALESPSFVDNATAEMDYMEDEDLILGVKIGNEIRGYAHPILDWHEIINDEVNGVSFAVTYCPLTGTGINWNRTLNGDVTTFGVSGLLYNTNLIPYDRATQSFWSQMRSDCVNGDLRGDDAEVIPMVEMSWATWKDMFPNGKVTSKDTGHNRQYGSYPYGSYRTNHDQLLFPISPDDKRLDRKERVLGVVIAGEAKVYQFDHFDEAGDGTEVITDQFKGEDLVIVGSESKNFIVAYNRLLDDGTLLNFLPVNEVSDAVMRDTEGNVWNIFGEAIEGPRTGQQLNAPNAYIGYWLAWGSFYQTVIY